MEEIQRLRRIACDPRNPKSVKAAALAQLRPLEAQAGVVSQNYNSDAFKA